MGTSNHLLPAAFGQTSEDSAAGPSPLAPEAEAASARHHKSASAPQCNTLKRVRVGVGCADEEHLRQLVHGVLVDRTTRSGTWESTAPLPGRNPENASRDRRPNNASSRRGARRHGEDMAACAGTLLQALAVTSSGMGWRPLDRGSNVRQASLSDKDTKGPCCSPGPPRLRSCHMHIKSGHARVPRDDRREAVTGRIRLAMDSSLLSMRDRRGTHKKYSFRSVAVNTTCLRQSVRATALGQKFATGRSPICHFLIKQRLR